MPHVPARPFSAALIALVLATAMPLATFAADADRDGLSDGFETKWGLTDPNQRDSDFDGVIDSAEDLDGDGLGNLGEQRAGTDPGKKDTDGDGQTDDREDHDGDGRTNAREQDQRALPAGLKPTLKRAPSDAPYTLGKRCSPTAGSAKLVKCHFGNRNSDTTIVLMGDSHARTWVEAAWRSAKAKDWHLITLLKGACPSLRGVYTVAMHNANKGTTCRTWRNRALDWVGKRGSKIDALILTHSDGQTLAKLDGTVIHKDNAAPVWAAGLRKTLKAIPERIDVIVLADVPLNTKNPVRCLRFHPKNMSACVSPRETAAELANERAMRAVARQEGEFPRSLNDQICPYDPCPVVQGDTLIWRDKTHLTATIARRLTPSFRRMVNEVLLGID